MSHDYDEPAAPSGPAAQDPVVADAATPDGSDESTVENAGGAVPRAELEKVIRERQAAKQRARAAEEQLAERVSSGDVDDLQRKLADREAQLAAVLRDQHLRRAATRCGAVNPEQVVRILQSRVTMAAEDDGSLAPTCLDEAGRPMLADDGTPAGADALVASFLNDPANANLLGPVSAPGSGARLSGAAPIGGEGPLTLSEFHALSPQQRRAAAMRMSPQQREAMLGVARGTRDGYL